MRIEHWGYQVADPAATAAWYAEHLGFTVTRLLHNNANAHFLADGSGRVMIEIYNNPRISVPDYAAMDPLLAHLAFVCDDVPATIAALVAAGATVVGPAQTTPAGDTLAMLRDPWGMAIQLCHRAEPMV
ncbi:MAG: VOC family protein [Rhodothermales bacterium]